MPLLDRLAEDRDVQPYPLPSAAGAGAALRRDVAVLSVRSRGGRRTLAGPGRTGVRSLEGRRRCVVRAARSVAGRHRVAVVVRQEGKRRLSIMSADGTNARTLAPSIDIQGAAGQGTADWSPDGTWIVTGGRDAQGPGLFKIPVDGGAPVRLVAGQAVNPVWSPDGNLIVYAGRSSAARSRSSACDRMARLSSCRTCGPPRGGYRFLPNGTGLVYLPRIQSLDFWLLDLATKKTRQLTRLSNQAPCARSTSHPTANTSCSTARGRTRISS